MKKLQMNKEAEGYIFKYVETIFAFEKALTKTYKLHENPYTEQSKFPNPGQIIVDGNETEYLFHGNGCTFKNRKFEIGYCVYPDRENYIVTGPFEFMQFVNSTNPDNHIGQMDALAYLQNLEQGGIVTKIFDDYLAFAVNLSWFKVVSNSMYK